MATRAGSSVLGTVLVPSGTERHDIPLAGTFARAEGTVTSVTYFRMVGRDVDAGTLTYRYWNVPNVPDFTGSLYSGPKSGATPLADIVVIGG